MHAELVLEQISVDGYNGWPIQLAKRDRLARRPAKPVQRILTDHKVRLGGSAPKHGQSFAKNWSRGVRWLVTLFRQCARRCMTRHVAAQEWAPDCERFRKKRGKGINVPTCRVCTCDAKPEAGIITPIHS